MGKRVLARSARGLAVLGILVMLSTLAHAAGEWEWTEGAGWTMGAGVSRPTPKEQLHYAYELEQKGEFMDSARQYFLLIQNFPNSEEAGVGLQRLARCLFEMENYYTSYRAIEQVIKTYPNTGRMSDLVEIELRIAKRMMLSQTPDILSESTIDNEREANVRRALEIVSSVIEHDPYGPVAAEAYLVRGEGNLFIGEINTARTAFETIRDEFPRSDYVERARLGILRCDSLVGQARPQELAEQIEVVREEERKRLEAGRENVDDFDDVEESLRQLAEVEAAKMLDQANQYRRMGTRAAVKSSEFLYKEIVRRYPNTAQAEEAQGRLGNITLPKEPGRIATAFKNINLNPFSWNKDPEPPWIVPQMAPEDMVMVDAGLGPIVGVPETGAPPTSGSAGVRPAGLGEGSADLGFSPASSAPGGPAPSYVDGVAGTRTYSSDPSRGPVPPPGYMDLEPSRGTSFLQNNPLPTITESDLIDVNGAQIAAGQGFAGGASSYPPNAGYGSGIPAPTNPLQPEPQQPSLNGLQYNASLDDLVGPTRRPDIYSPPPVPAPGSPYVVDPYSAPYPEPQPGSYYAQPPVQYGQPQYAPPTTPPSVSDPRLGTGGWTMGDDFR